MDELSYDQAIQMVLPGDSFVHPKTIQPLQENAIRLEVRSFLDPEQTGTIIKG